MTPTDRTPKAARLAPSAAVLLLLTIAWVPPATTRAGEEPDRWPTPELDEQSYGRWLKFIRPSEDELKWRQVRWHKHLSDAAEEARRLERPILLYTMNGHPCGET
jgi:hypothetical protein